MPSVVRPFVTSLTAAAQPWPGNLSQNLVFQYGFGEGGGTSINDGFGYFPGTYKGSTPGWNTEPYVPSVVMNGSDNYINCGTSIPWLSTSANPVGVSVFMWVRATAYPGSLAMMFGIEDGGSNFDIELLLRSDGRWALYFESGAFDPLSSSTALTTNQWTHIGFTYGAPEGLTAFQNGVVVGSAGLGSPTIPFHSAFHLYLAGNSQFSGRYFTGNIGPTAMWQRKLGFEEVQLLYAMPETLYLPSRNIWGVTPAAAGGGGLQITPNWNGGFADMVGGLWG